MKYPHPEQPQAVSGNPQEGHTHGPGRTRVLIPLPAGLVVSCASAPGDRRDVEYRGRDMSNL